jgi:PleD family two-component response regulator
MIAARVLGYGKDYTFELNGEEHTVDLTEVKDKELKEEDLISKGQNEFEFTLPTIKKTITFKILTHGDERKIENEIKGIKKVRKNESPEPSTRLKHMILSVDGDTERKNIREFVDTQLLARDARALRNYIKEIQPDVDLVFNIETEVEEKEVRIPIGITFFWPDSEL